MRTFPIIVLLLCYSATHGWSASGDVPFWIPFQAGPESRQVIRNSDYISIRLHKVYVYYKSGFFENIEKVIIASEVELTGTDRKVQGAMINKVWPRTSTKAGDFVAVDDHLAVLTPATAEAVKIKITFRGIGEDVFKPIFDIASDPTLKTAINLSPATLGAVAVVTPVVQKLLASPYTSIDTKNILDLTASFAFYPDGSGTKPDAPEVVKPTPLERFLQITRGKTAYIPLNPGEYVASIEKSGIPPHRFVVERRTDAFSFMFSGAEYNVVLDREGSYTVNAHDFKDTQTASAWNFNPTERDQNIDQNRIYNLNTYKF